MHRGDRYRKIVTWLAAAGVLLLLGTVLWNYFGALEPSRIAERIRDIGPAALLILLPWAAATAADTIGWSHCVPDKRHGIPLRKLFLLRLSTEALVNTLPAGAAVAETARPILLKKRFGLDLTQGITSCFVTKINIAATQAAFILVGLCFSIITYPGFFNEIGVPGGAVTAFAFTIAFLGLLALPYTGPRLTQAYEILLRFPVAGVRSLLSRIRIDITRIDTLIGGFRKEQPLRLLISLAWFMASWCFFAFETFLILRLLGAEITYTHAITLEATASVLRILFFYVPGGLGAQELGFVVLLTSFGLPDPLTLSASFIMLKRSKEAFWAAVGYITMGTNGLRLKELARARRSPASMRCDKGIQPADSSLHRLLPGGNRIAKLLHRLCRREPDTLEQHPHPPSGDERPG